MQNLGESIQHLEAVCVVCGKKDAKKCSGCLTHSIADTNARMQGDKDCLTPIEQLSKGDLIRAANGSLIQVTAWRQHNAQALT